MVKHKYRMGGSFVYEREIKLPYAYSLHLYF